MTTKITAIYDNPADPEEFDAAWDDGTVDLAEQLPGLQRIETSKVWPKEDGSPAPAYRMIDLYFPDYESASAAVATDEGGALFARLAELGTAGVKFIFFDLDLTEQFEPSETVVAVVSAEP